MQAALDMRHARLERAETGRSGGRRARQIEEDRDMRTSQAPDRQLERRKIGIRAGIVIRKRPKE